MKPILSLIAVIFFFSCNQAKRSAVNDDSIQKEIRATIDDYYSDIRNKGLLAEFAYLDSSSRFFWIPPGYLNYIGYDSVAAAIRMNAAVLRAVDNRYDSLLIIPLSDEYAQFAMRTVSTAVHTTGDTTKTAFLESGVMVRRKNGWKFLSGHTTLLE